MRSDRLRNSCEKLRETPSGPGPVSLKATPEHPACVDCLPPPARSVPADLLERLSRQLVLVAHLCQLQASAVPIQDTRSLLGKVQHRPPPPPRFSARSDCQEALGKAA